jgi:diguanylate cyclase (GGDEF)-like protein
MFNLADHIVALTEHRDRDLLDVRLTESLMDLLAPFSVAIFAVLTDEGTRRWLPLTYMERDCVIEIFDPLWSDAGELQLLAEVPHRARCLNELQRVTLEPSDDRLLHVTCLPLFADLRVEGQGVIEIRSETELNVPALNAVTRLLRVYGNMYGMLEYSERDSLTGLLNRKSFDDSFYKVLREPAGEDDRGGMAPGLLVADEFGERPDARQPHTPAGASTGYWLAMIDIDHFKKVNDQHGHLIGDEVLILVGRILKTTFRLLDRVYRFGGEEFVVVLRSKDGATAEHILERFRANMEEHEFPQVGTITASVGLSEILLTDSPSAACERADQAVYYAKKNGRNRVCLHADLVNRGLLQDDVKVGGIELF